jgi:hypothetical protein
MKPRFLLLVCAMALSIWTFGKGKPTPVTQVQITLDANGLRKAVSPFIYGKNNSLSDNSSSPLTSTQWLQLRDAGIMMFREGGGNNSTKYNYLKKLSSHPDWYNNVYAHDWDFAATSLHDNIPAASGMWTLSLIGKVADNTTHNFNDWGYNRSQWWSGCAQNLAGGGTVNPNGGSAALVNGNPDLYLQNWTADDATGILDKWMGTGGLGLDPLKLKYWNMDNEPEIWSSTHDDVMPVQLQAEEFMQRYFVTAKKARAKFPGIKLVGPVPCNEWQWYNWNNDRILYNGQYYCWLEYFIKRIAEEQANTGIRLLDVLDIHFYPVETASSDIVQLHRVFFDRTYDYPGNNGVHRLGSSGWDTTIKKEYIFGRCMDWLNSHMGTGHGVTFSLSEMDVQTSDPNVRAVWYASTLGEFEKQGVEIFTPWSWGVGMYEVVHLFSKYNQAYFLNATSSDEVNVSAYPTINSTGNTMTVMLVNRSLTATKEAKITLSNFPLTSTPVTYYRINALTTTETFKSHSVNGLKTGTVTPVSNTLTVSLPPLSVTSLQLNRPASSLSRFAETFSKLVNLSVYPNPAISDFTVSWPTSLSGESRVEVFNANGQLITERIPDKQTLNNHKIQFNCESWPSGMYIVHFKSQGTTGSAKINVQH